MRESTATATIMGDHVETVRRTVTEAERFDGITVSATYLTSLTGETRFCCFSCAREVGEFYAKSFNHVSEFKVREIDENGRMRRYAWTVQAR